MITKPKLPWWGADCPHSNIADCPLYHGMHVPGGPSCHSDKLDEGLCAVALGADYDALVAALRARHPKVVAECEFGADVRASKEQRARNMRASGVH